jgi:NADH-quinone oxidoreductase subunit L
MTVPLTVLAIGSALAGLLGTPKLWRLPEFFRGFEGWLAPMFGAGEAAGETAHGTGAEWGLMGLSVLIAIAGIALARYLYNAKPGIPDRIQASLGPLHKLLYNKWYIDELYDFLFVNGLGKGGGRVCGAFDRDVVDGGVNGAGWLTRFSASVSMWWDTWIVDGAVRLTAFSVKLSSFPVRIFQTGSVQAYALVFVVGVAAVFGYYLVR